MAPNPCLPPAIRAVISLKASFMSGAPKVDIFGSVVSAILILILPEWSLTLKESVSPSPAYAEYA